MNCAIMFYFHLSYFVQVAISSENPYVMGRFCGSFGFVLELTDTNFSGFISSPGSLNVAIFPAPGRRYKKLRSFVQKPCISNVHKKEDTGFLHKTPPVIFCAGGQSIARKSLCVGQISRDSSWHLLACQNGRSRVGVLQVRQCIVSNWNIRM